MGAKTEALLSLSLLKIGPYNTLHMKKPYQKRFDVVYNSKKRA